MRKPILIQEYIEQRIGPNPLKVYMESFQKHIESMRTGASSWKCSYCGEVGRGFSDMLSGRFKCFGCFFNEEFERVEKDPDMVKKVRVWNLRAAREKRLILEEWKNNVINPPITDGEPLMQTTNLTQEQKKELAKKLMDTIDLPVNSSETGL